MKKIGETFVSELLAAGLLGLPFAWGEDGAFQFDERMTPEQIDQVEAVYAAHDPTKKLPADPM
ncbi:hypothetical protein [Herbaspirillum frisingense]|uniref:Uncharacterized protein n=1 Tax=Herbaspirillum frisingense TaxID=92645 RepID=A0ABU1PHU6_9BURK|nr:hypothetical protein [Herbaspirillum frisingense]MDR6585518.1 hypothetical protein [Herbaspirillum frisingense]